MLFSNRDGFTLIEAVVGIIIIDNTIVILVNELTFSIFILWKYFARHIMIAIFISS